MPDLAAGSWVMKWREEVTNERKMETEGALGNGQVKGLGNSW